MDEHVRLLEDKLKWKDRQIKWLSTHLYTYDDTYGHTEIQWISIAKEATKNGS